MRLALTVADSIISISLERDIRVFPLHPTVERIVKKEVRQHGADKRALWGSSFPADQGSVRHAHGCLEPSLNVKQHPFAVRVSAHGAHQKFPVDSVEDVVVWNLLLQADSGGPSPISDKAFTAHNLATLLQVFLAALRSLAENHDVVPVDPLLALALFVGVGLVGCDRKARHRLPARRQMPQFRILAEMADQHYSIP